MKDIQAFARDCLLLREQSPLILNVTNYVAAPFTANVLLAAGASPIMSFCEEEIEELVEQSAALVINIGCLDRFQKQTMLKAAQAAHSLGRPWVLDPAGVGASRFRADCVSELIEEYHPSVIRGNAAEIAFLCGMETQRKGMDSTVAASSVVKAADGLNARTGAVISISGQTDYIVSPMKVELVPEGDTRMKQVTAMGCAASALTGAFAALREPFDAAYDAMKMMGIAGEMAACSAKGTGSFASAFLDALSTFSPFDWFGI